LEDNATVTELGVTLYTTPPTLSAPPILPPSSPTPTPVEIALFEGTSVTISPTIMFITFYKIVKIFRIITWREAMSRKRW